MAALAHNGTRPGHRTQEEDRWLGSPEQVAERWRPHAELGFRHLIAEIPTPFDLETVERLAEVRDLLAKD